MVCTMSNLTQLAKYAVNNSLNFNLSEQELYSCSQKSIVKIVIDF